VKYFLKLIFFQQVQADVFQWLEQVRLPRMTWFDPDMLLAISEPLCIRTGG
jgi:hypothetical protein